MHRLAATPGGWTPGTDGVIFVDQTPASIVFMSAADTDIQCLAGAIANCPPTMPSLRAVNILQLQQQLAIDTYGEEVLSHAQLIIVRLLGGRAYWSYGLEVTKATVAATGAALIVLPGDDRPDPDLMSHSTVSLQIAHRLWCYLREGGIENLRHGLMEVCDRCLQTQFDPPGPIAVAKVGPYPFSLSGVTPPVKEGATIAAGLDASAGVSADPRVNRDQAISTQVGILFYRAHYLSGNTAPIDALCQALWQRGLTPVPVYVSSLQDAEVQAALLTLLQTPEEPGIGVLLNTTSFAVAKLDSATPRLDLWQQLDVPVLQVILSGGTQEAWAQNPMGLSPRDIAMNVALPEVDGRIITRAVAFKATAIRSEALETDVVAYETVSDRVDFVADLTAQWLQLRHIPAAQRRVALILANYPTRDGRLANGVGLDTPQSCVEILQALQHQGYTVTDIPAHGDALIQRLTDGLTNDPEGRPWRSTPQTILLSEYGDFFRRLPLAVQAAVQQRWGRPEDELARWSAEDGSSPAPMPSTPQEDSDFPAGWPQPHPPEFAIPGLQLGNVFIGIQPSRGYDQDPSLNYHAPDLEPTHRYLSFYTWIREHFQAHAVVHVGKHGNLEWLPGKGMGLSQDCYPEVALGPLPHLYPFIVNDPGEGAQAKRRSQAIIIDHLTPPLTRAELYGPLQQLEQYVDEYYEAQSLDPVRLPRLRDRILVLLQETALLTDLALSTSTPPRSAAGVSAATFAELLPTVDGYLCELKEAQIRDGLHIFGRCPTGRPLRDLLIAIARHPAGERLGLTRAMATDWQLQLDPLVDDLAQAWQLPSDRLPPPLIPVFQGCRTVGDAVDCLEEQAAAWVDYLLQQRSLPAEVLTGQEPHITQELEWIRQHLLPVLQQTPQEIQFLLRGLNGQYVPSGPAGAPTRNRPDVLPTGRNFYSVDIRAIPTESAWDVGRKAAEVLVEQYTQDHGDYPRALGLSLWGTATMRTGGDDLAEALALLGVRPVWDGPSRRVVDFEILPVSLLGRPRVDVTLRISGFFRDAFPNLIDLFDQAVTAVAQLSESPEDNPLAAQTVTDCAYWQTQGLNWQEAIARSRYRIFGSKPGAYGAGLQGLIEAQNWTDDQDLARAYINWSSYAYGHQTQGRAMPAAFEQRLSQLQVVLHNQDNREHDLLDSDDYYQFQGGMVAAVSSLSGRSPQTYFGDHAVPENPKVRSLKQEIARVYRSRVVNPKWIAGVMRHGYKGAFEMAATVDYLFAYDATTHCVENHMYEGVAQAYLLEPTTRQFIERVNPWALRDMAERLLEAHQRQLWQGPSRVTLDALRAIVHEAEGQIETRQGTLPGAE